MRPLRLPRAPHTLDSILQAAGCRILALAAQRASAETIAGWRRQPLVIGGETMPVSFLKHAEDQTIIALKTLLGAIAQEGWVERSFGDWGVVAAPTFFGRQSIVQSFERYAQEGAWGISPNLIPHHSLHGLSGTISQALKIYGPNFGIGGGTDPSTEALLLATALLADGQLPGLWLVLTGHDSELMPHSSPVPTFRAVVLALAPTAEALGECSDEHIPFADAQVPASFWSELEQRVQAREVFA
jgi:hypothetical protein